MQVKIVNGVELVTVTKEDFDYLVERDNFLTCLEEGGVDKWSGFEFACEIYDTNSTSED